MKNRLTISEYLINTRTTLIVLCAVMCSFPNEILADDTQFETQIRPLLVNKCITCHGLKKQSGGLRLDSGEALAKGGKKGQIVDLQTPSSSRLLKAVHRDGATKAMPPDEDLSSKEIASLEKWVINGAKWPSKVSLLYGKNHWAFEPLATNPTPGSINLVDQWIDQGLVQKNLKPLEKASRNVLLRRMAFDLIGLPPTLVEQERFNHLPNETWFSEAMEYFLAHPGYGVRWGRMWLDVVRYADTAGETADFPVPQAWRYRNWVIQAFRDDIPFNTFLQKQIAGDLLSQKPGVSHKELEEGTIATGYWAIARRFGYDVLEDHYLTIEDAIDTLGKSVLGLGLACARCHDHKYDPISTKDYYSLYGILESTRFPMPGCEKRNVPADLISLAAKETRDRLAKLDHDLAKLVKRSVDDSKAWTELLTKSTPLSRGIMPNRAEITLPAIRDVSVEAGDLLLLTLLAGKDHGADSTQVEIQVTHQGKSGQKIHNATEDLLQDATQNNQRPSSGWIPLDLSGTTKRMDTFQKDAHNIKGLKVWKFEGEVPSVFANTNPTAISFSTVKQPKACLGLHPGPKGPVGLGLPILESGKISVDTRLLDMDPGGTDGVIGEIRILRNGTEIFVGSEKGVEQITALQKTIKELKEGIPLIYAVTEGTPHDAQLQNRGNPKDRGDTVSRQNLTLLGGQKLLNPKQSGRLELAAWVTEKANPLTARVYVNRVWQGHFGHGMVRTPNDFGLRGDLPSHPQLLDSLANYFQAKGGSTKAIHRLILHSNSWQRSSFATKELVDKDPDNRWLARFPRLRLSAEEIRDSLLLVSNELDQSDGGAHPFPNQANWGFTQHGPFRANYDHKKRSAFLMVQRIQRHPFLGLFDGADPNSSTASRQLTTAPPQALWYLNNPFVFERANSILSKLPIETPEARMDRLCRLLLGRNSTSEDLEDAPKTMDSEAWATLIRILMASNEFIYRD